MREQREAGGELVLVGCGTWAGTVLERLDPQARRVASARRLHLVGVESDSGAGSADRLPLVLPSVTGFRQQVTATTDPRRRAALLPGGRASDGDAAALDLLDALYRHRFSLLVAESRVKQRLAALLQGASHVVLIAAPDEPIAAGAVLLLGQWIREASRPSPPRMDLLLGLEPMGPGAAQHAERAARQHAFLAELDQGRGGSGGAEADASFDGVLVAGRQALGRADLAAACAETLAWWTHLVSLGAAPDERHARWRGRPVNVHVVTALTARLDSQRLAADAAGQVASAVAARLAASSHRSALVGHAERMANEIRALLEIPQGGDLLRAVPDADLPAESALVPAARLAKALEKSADRATSRRHGQRLALVGGAIDRITGKVAPGHVDAQVEWAWQCVRSGHATLDDVIAMMGALDVALGLMGVDTALREATRRVEELEREADRRRRSAATIQALGAAHAELLRAADVRNRLEVTQAVLSEVRDVVGRSVRSFVAARNAVASLASVSHPASSAATSPWRCSVPVPAAALPVGPPQVAALGSAWLDRLGPASAALAALARGAEACRDDLAAFVSDRVEEVLGRQPAWKTPGVERWLTDAVRSVPPVADVDDSVLPGPPRVEAILFAARDAPGAIGAALDVCPTLQPSDDTSRIGWACIVGPLPLCAISGLRDGHAPLAGARRDGHLPEGATDLDPCTQDLAERVDFELARRGLPPVLPGGLAAVTRGRDPLLGLLPALRTLPRDAPAFLQAAAIGDWADIPGLNELTGIERSVQDLQARREPDGSDAELESSMAAVAGVVVPLKKGLEANASATRLFHHAEARAAIERARDSIVAGLAGFERRALLELCERWGQWLAEVMAALRGRTELTMRLRTRQVFVRGHATLLFEVENRSAHPSLATRVELLASPSFRRLGEPTVELGPLAPGERRVVELALKPRGSGPTPVEVALSWDDLEASGKTARMAEVVDLVERLPPFRRIERNPYIAGPPVRSQEMFFGREDIFRYVRDSLAGRYQDNVLILHGQRRTGKSSILCQLERRDLLPEHVPVLVDLQGLGGFDTASFLHQLARHATRGLARQVGREVALLARTAFTEAPWSAFQEQLDTLEDALASHGRRLLFMIDEFDALETRVAAGHVEPDVFPFLRNIMQHREHVAFLLAGTHQLVDMRHDYGSILFSLASYRKVSMLSSEDAAALVRAPLEGEVVYDDLVVESLIRLTAGHPYYLQLTCQNLVQRLNQVAVHACVLPDDLEAVLPEVLEAATGHFEHEWRTLDSPVARCVIAAMAELDDTGLRWYSAAEIARLLSPHRVAGRAVGVDDVSQALSALSARDVVEGSTGGEAWRLRIDLLRHWLRRHRPLARATAEPAARAS